MTAPEVSFAPSFVGQFSVSEEKRARDAIWGHLQRYAHGTGALAGEDVVAWFVAQSERAWEAGRPAPVENDAGVSRITRQGNLPPDAPKPQPHLRDEASQEGTS